jgi:hypothetical protein
MTPRQVIPADAISTADLLTRLGLRGLADVTGADNPDARLLAALDELADAERDTEAAMANWQGHPARRVGSVAEAHRAFVIAAEAMMAVKARVITTPAQTLPGALAKMRFTLEKWDDGRSGSFMDLPLSAIRDALAVGLGVVIAKAEAPVWGRPPAEPDGGGILV